jgi:hypothetical protein
MVTAMLNVVIDGKIWTLTPAQLLAEGGEANVYDLQDGRVAKIWKDHTHPDFAHSIDLQAIAKQRIVEYGAKVAALPNDLATRLPQVATPNGLVTSAQDRSICGFVMKKLSGDPLHHFGEQRFCRDRGFTRNQAVALLLSLYDAVCAVHQAGMVIGDFNDLNVMVCQDRALLLDVDSFQFGQWKTHMFTERFVDPRLCKHTGNELQMIAAHDQRSDWFAFHAIAMRILLWAGPWSGTQSGCTKAITLSQRIAQRLTALSVGIIYPRAALPLSVLPTTWQKQLATVFAGAADPTLARTMLSNVQFTDCPSCLLPFAADRCPCGALPAAQVRKSQSVTATDIHPNTAGQGRFAVAGASATRRVTIAGSSQPRPPIWISGNAIWRSRGIAAERIGNLVSGESLMWANQDVGAGLYRVGNFTVGLWFNTQRGIVNEFTGLRSVRGQIVTAYASIAAQQAWITITSIVSGKCQAQLISFDRHGKSISFLDLTDSPWADGLPGACALGESLYVPSDTGVVRLQCHNNAIIVTKQFAETTPWVNASSQLVIDQRGLVSISNTGACALAFT